LPLDEIEEFRNEILKAGTHLASVSSVDFPDAKSVSNTIAGVLSVVEGYKLVRRWVTSSVSNTEEEYVMTKEICHVNFCVFSLLINVMRNFYITIGFSSGYSTGRYQLRCKIEQVF
jgi:hypothetical protein